MQKDTWALKVKSAPINKWILHTANIESFDFNTEVWVEK